MANPNPSPATRFAPGCSGNPKGRPPGRTLTTRLRAKLAEVDPETGRTFAELVAEALVHAALAGDIQAIRLILDRTEGKVPTRVLADDGLPAYVFDPGPAEEGAEATAAPESVLRLLGGVA